MVRAISAGRASILITYGSGGKIRTVTVPVEVPAPPFRVSPSPFDFGVQKIGTAWSREMTLTNTLDEPLVIKSITAEADDFTSSDTCAAPLAPGASCTITVVFTPARTGYSQKFIRITNQNFAVGVSVSGTGSASGRAP